MVQCYFRYTGTRNSLLKRRTQVVLLSRLVVTTNVYRIQPVIYKVDNTVCTEIV